MATKSDIPIHTGDWQLEEGETRSLIWRLPKTKKYLTVAPKTETCIVCGMVMRCHCTIVLVKDCETGFWAQLGIYANLLRALKAARKWMNRYPSGWTPDEVKVECDTCGYDEVRPL